MAAHLKQTVLFQSMTNEWRAFSESRRTRQDLHAFLDTSPNESPLASTTVDNVIKLVNTLTFNTGDRFRPIHDRQILGGIVDASAHNPVAFRVAVQAALGSSAGGWWTKRFGWFDAEEAAVEYAHFVTVELADPAKVSTRRNDPLACVRLNASNRAVSALSTCRRRQRLTPATDPVKLIAHRQGTQRPNVVRHDNINSEPNAVTLESLVNYVVTAAKGTTSADARNYVLHAGYQFSYRDLQELTGLSRSAVQRRCTAVGTTLQVI